MTDGHRDKPTDERFRSAKLKRVVIEVDGEVQVWERWVPEDEPPSEALCGECGTNTIPDGQPWEWYTVHDHVWQTVRRGDVNCHYLCIGCLEQRLGRQLVATDFPDSPVNRPSRNDTPRLASRKATARDAHD